MLPVVLLEPYEEFEDGLTAVNASRFGLQAGVFTRSHELARKAFETLQVGAVITFAGAVVAAGTLRDARHRAEPVVASELEAA